MRRRDADGSAVIVVRWHVRQRASKDIFASAKDSDCWKKDLIDIYIYNERKSTEQNDMEEKEIPQSPCL